MNNGSKIARYFGQGVLQYMAEKDNNPDLLPKLDIPDEERAFAEDYIQRGYEWAGRGGYEQMPESKQCAQ